MKQLDFYLNSVIFFYAVSEGDVGFLTGYDTSFEMVYRSLLPSKENNYFREKFRDYLTKHILTDRYRNSIEEYGYFDEKYNKLSEEMQNAYYAKNFFEDYKSEKYISSVHYLKREMVQRGYAELIPHRLKIIVHINLEKIVLHFQKFSEWEEV